MINIEEFWEDAKDELSKSIQAISYEVWIEKLEPVCFVDNAIVLSTISANAKRTMTQDTKTPSKKWCHLSIRQSRT